MPWNEEHEAELKRLHGEGLSPGKIARRLGAGYSRNAVIGKINRLRSSASKQKRASTKSLPPKSGTTAAVEPAELIAPLPPEPVFAPREVVTAEPPLNLTLLELTNRTCKWPTGKPDGEQLFCGLAQDSAVEPYCRAHGDIAFSPAALRIKWDRAIRRNGAARR